MLERWVEGRRSDVSESEMSLVLVQVERRGRKEGECARRASGDEGVEREEIGPRKESCASQTF